MKSKLPRAWQMLQARAVRLMEGQEMERFLSRTACVLSVKASEALHMRVSIFKYCCESRVSELRI